MRKVKMVFIVILISLISFHSHSHAFLSEIFDIQAMKFARVKDKISENILIVRNLNEEKMKEIKRSFAPWQRLILRNSLNEIIEVEIFFQSKNDFYSPPVKKNFLLKKVILQPKENVILLFPINRWGIEEKYGVHGRFFIFARSYQKTASGVSCSGEMKKKINLSYRHYRKVVLEIEDKKISLKGNEIRFTKWNMYPRKRYRRNYLPFHLIKIKFERRW